MSYDTGSQFPLNQESGWQHSDVSGSKPHPGSGVGGWQPSASDPFGQSYLHRESISASDSASSRSNSPTAANSALDSHSVSETPSTSPDTPASTHFLTQHTHPMALRMNPSGKPDAVADTAKVLPAPKKARNLKNLAVNTTSAAPWGRAVATAALPIAADQGNQGPPPPTPGAFMKPLKTPGRKNSAMGLTIQTKPTINTKSQEPGIVPPTPSLIRPATLRHFQSSPSLPTLASAIGSQFPINKMELPLPNGKRLIPVGFSDAVPEQDESSESPNYDVPLSRELKPESYPDGPICIYDPHVYLYFEPSAHLASGYDVIFNVASEVKNPFTARNASETTIKALPHRQDSSATPTAPKAEDAAADADHLDMPEYIHVPWEHNTDIVPDLYHLVKLIDEKVQEGKKILIHCQCGVSRSASLIVAYGLYKNPSMTVQEAYDAVKRRSKWISPNMNLIMQLQEFRSGLLRSSAGFTTWKGNANPRSNISYGRPRRARTMTDGSLDNVPQSAPLQEDANKLLPPPISVENSSPVAPGPSSAPSDYHWPSSTSPSDAPKPHLARPAMVAIHPQPAYVDPSGHILPGTAVATSSASASPARTLLPLRSQPPIIAPVKIEEALESARSAEFSMNTAIPPPTDDTFGLTSPRNTSFGAMQQALPLRTKPVDVQPLVVSESEPLQSPRSEAFAMTSIIPPTNTADDSFGLTSPKASGFNLQQLPFRRAWPSFKKEEETRRISVVLPSQDEEVQQKQSKARAELKSKLGLSTRSNIDLRTAYKSTSKEAPSLPPLNLSPIDLSIPSPIGRSPKRSSVDDALLSPRATEFTNNPFHQSLFPEPAAQKPEQSDPRSPPQKGASPIVRNIADVL